MNTTRCRPPGIPFLKGWCDDGIVRKPQVTCSVFWPLDEETLPRFLDRQQTTVFAIQKIPTLAGALGGSSWWLSPRSSAVLRIRPGPQPAIVGKLREASAQAAQPVAQVGTWVHLSQRLRGLALSRRNENASFDTSCAGSFKQGPKAVVLSLLHAIMQSAEGAQAGGRFNPLILATVLPFQTCSCFHQR